MEKIIHLFVLEKCTHYCRLCCNHQYPTAGIPVVNVEELSSANTLCITGGEPFLIPEIGHFAMDIKLQYPNINRIYIYTCGDSLYDWLQHHPLEELDFVDGLNISPKNAYDVARVVDIFTNAKQRKYISEMASSRLYLFPHVDRAKIDSLHLEECPNIAIMDREWQEKFEANSGVFRRLPILFNPI